MMLLVIALLTIFTFLTWRNLETGILLLCALLPSYLIRFSIMGVPTTFLEIMALIVIGVWGVRRCITLRTGGSRPAPTQNDRILNMAIILLVIAATIGIFISPDKLAAVGVWKAFYLEPVLMFFVIRDVMGTHKGHPYEYASKIFRALGVNALLVSLFGLVQYFFSIGIPTPWDLERRITSIFDYPNALVLFLEPIIVISWFEIKKVIPVMGGVPRPRLTTLLFWITVSILATINVFLAQSEAGIAALIVTALCILVASKRTRKYALASIVIISALVFAIPTSRTYLVEKLTFQDSSEQVRLSQWKETIELLKDHSIMGVGLSGYPIALKPYHHDLQYEIFQYPHNIVLNIWVELGLLGLVAVGLLAFRLGYIAYMWAGHDPPLQIRMQHIMFCAIFFEIILHGLVDVPYFKNDLAMMVWVLIACMMVMNRGSIYEQKNQG
ncbi:hypothetical protein A3C09_02765 [Candidatus Uhrbacteria bacterium RIFCSPHIGHO2_02_FULL_47_44]|uniref:O-antigen ligase-related domain-containing protein n=1 Tax=Candidatus Uhrbacteria bacterium RIFCSPLOWO2_02_FULL_48_18 TaxID=1802408 RepID=A0A1F7V8C9_9BACT|nr:MAG: hypothetical protein A2839_01415 [Candidatus Uhrbacteria bacterium RIFCSPHIGHO2_01_FULL_47_10]OGL70219.1 MAG: hypothetical protein A3C09_02765 [Candidatus Uhrbacteria bacterium RIFCSPHIGHO2_02_FULL_47_44]OGL77241.1 MAG: hypothetical protein A3E97_01060 [Candidatus Uhrbacteria bacterium RIFCSPHIGHO2_12_FULL_47_12]OGL80468.1 MAG: hypothetical protein A3B20_03610 [Candidatus Uhrbacteria bacterium RIFCSPLOWO2_01_FULL_47_17]OGL86328.1 MAG: hypothetical protein A3I41_02090 [Candidatus Uhrbact